MELLKNFPIENIIISEDFKRTQPGSRKMESAEARYQQTGELPAIIVINDENVLIDGYITYLTALNHGIVAADVYRGWEEVIEAVHGQQDHIFKWRVPRHLVGMIKPVDKVLVTTAKGVKRVRVVNVMRYQYTDQSRNLKRVWKIYE